MVARNGKRVQPPRLGEGDCTAVYIVLESFRRGVHPFLSESEKLRLEKLAEKIDKFWSEDE